MTDPTAWIADRRPAAPDDLRARVEEHVVGSGEEGLEAVGRVDVLGAAAREALERAVDRPGRVRESAFDLLVADALVTYACEAALESERPAEALLRIVEVGRDP